MTIWEYLVPKFGETVREKPQGWGAYPCLSKWNSNPVLNGFQDITHLSSGFTTCVLISWTGWQEHWWDFRVWNAFNGSAKDSCESFGGWPCKWLVWSFTKMLMLPDEWIMAVSSTSYLHGLWINLLSHFIFSILFPIYLHFFMFLISCLLFFPSHSFYSLQILAWKNTS